MRGGSRLRYDKIMIVAECQSGKINRVAFELLGKARALFGHEAKIAFSVAGRDIGQCVDQLQKAGSNAIYYMDDKRLEHYHPDYIAAATLALVKEFDPDVLLVGATSVGEELAPTLGSRLATGVAAHCIDLILKDNILMQMVPAFGGKVIGEIFTPKHRPAIASIKPGIFQETQQPPCSCEIYQVSSTVLDEIRSPIKYLSSEQTEFEGIPIESAELIVCGGNGIGDAQNWANLERLATLLGAGLAYTRPVIDNGWVKQEHGMIGTSGKSVRPKVYLGFGVSGATHHVCGFKDANTIITINNKKDADVFDASDFKAVADAPSLINVLIEMLSNS